MNESEQNRSDYETEQMRKQHKQSKENRSDQKRGEENKMEGNENEKYKNGTEQIDVRKELRVANLNRTEQNRTK